ncbi:MAG: hypothetical protein WBF77_13765 [Sulfurimonadaceae bacterium]
MKRLLSILTLLSLSLFAQVETNISTGVNNDKKIVKEDGIEVYVNADQEEESAYNVTEDYNLSAESDFYLDAALRDYSELTDCEEDAKDQMADEAMAEADLCPTHNIDIRLAHPIEIKNVRVTSRKLSNDECSLDAVYTLSTLPPEEMQEIDAVCQDEYEGYGASLMLDDGLWQAIQIGFGVGYSGGGVGTFTGDLVETATGQKSAEYEYVGAPTMTLDAAYLYKLPLANLYALVGGELGWVMQQTNTTDPDPTADVIYDGGSPYIFRVGLNGGLGYRFHMRYDVQVTLGYQFQYLYRTVSTGETFQGYENNLIGGIRGAYHFHENFAVWGKLQHNTSSAIATVGLTYEFWD